jgi:hypothetical protein
MFLKISCNEFTAKIMISICFSVLIHVNFEVLNIGAAW